MEETLTKKEKRALAKEKRATEIKKKNFSHAFRKIALWIPVFLIVGVIGYGLYSTFKSGGETSQVLSSQVESIDHLKGNPEAKIIIVEYSDFQCPACAFYYGIVRKLMEEKGDEMAFVYRHFPLAQIHKNSERAAFAAEAAGRQGKFWEMHNALFDNQSSWENSGEVEQDFLKYAQEIGLNIDQFEADLKSQDVKDKVDRDYRSGLTSRVNATPTFFVNGTKIENPRSYESFKKIIEDYPF
jgi:protein-disulfide isomerase